jgi:drug/metabolite transporter (DMT)-like permease
MTLTAAILLIISAAAHAGWNLLGKRERPTLDFMLAANTFGFLLLIPAVIAFWDAQAFFSPWIWFLIVTTGLCQAVYYTGLAGAYRNGDLSIAYPLARSSPVILVAVATALLGLGKPLGPQVILGILVVVAGSFILPMHSFSDFRLKNYFNLTSLLALTAALGTTGYSIIDSEALRVLRLSASQQVAGAALTIVYAFWEGLLSSVWLALFVLARQAKSQEVNRLECGSILRAALVGLGLCVGYVLVLIAMGYVTNVSYVVAFRQLSIPLGALLGVLVLKEPRPPTRFVGVVVIFAGLALVGTG